MQTQKYFCGKKNGTKIKSQMLFGRNTNLFFVNEYFSCEQNSLKLNQLYFQKKKRYMFVTI